MLLQYTPSGDEPPLPDKIGAYHTLYPLEDLASSDMNGVSAAWGVRSSVLKGVSSRDGRAYVLRVVCGKQVWTCCVGADCAGVNRRAGSQGAWEIGAVLVGQMRKSSCNSDRAKPALQVLFLPLMLLQRLTQLAAAAAARSFLRWRC
jgi:hypothetical protein